MSTKNTYPSVNVNGSGKEILIRDRNRIEVALRKLEDSILLAWPHKRDYYIFEDGKDRYEAAYKLWKNRRAWLYNLMGEISEEITHLHCFGEEEKKLRRRQNKMTREKIMEEFQINEEGVITSPGKFFEEKLYIPYFWNFVVEGFADFIEGNYYIEIYKEDLENFPEMEKDGLRANGKQVMILRETKESIRKYRNPYYKS